MPDELVSDPTAVHIEAVMHEALFKTPLVAPLGSGIGAIDHLVPSQRAACEAPTAVQAVALVQDTPNRPLEPGVG
jgi:hypothetical protein